MDRAKRGFTLIELLVVIAIIAILAAILFPVFLKAKATAQETRCLNNLKQLNTALVSYTDDNNSTFPPAHSWGRMWDGGTNPNWLYIQDFIGRYVKSPGIWACPSVQLTKPVPDAILPKGTLRWGCTWSENSGSKGPRGHYKDVVTTYLFNYAYDTGPPNYITGMIAGTRVSKIVRATQALTFVEMPYWNGATPPHHEAAGRMVTAVYYDGHTKMERHGTDAYFDLSWRGWRYAP